MKNGKVLSFNLRLKNLTRGSIFQEITWKKVNNSLSLKWDDQGVCEGIEVKIHVAFEYPKEV